MKISKNSNLLTVKQKTDINAEGEPLIGWTNISLEEERDIIDHHSLNNDATFVLCKQEETVSFDNELPEKKNKMIRLNIISTFLDKNAANTASYAAVLLLSFTTLCMTVTIQYNTRLHPK